MPILKYCGSITLSRDELKKILVLIVCDLTLTKEMRSNLLGPELRNFMDANPDLNSQQVTDIWNSVMAEIVTENSLRRH